ncbi:MAG: threonine synthase [Patescibacteria group bacterium]
MRFHSTNKHSKGFSFSQAILAGLAPDGGLFMPDRWPSLPKRFFLDLKESTFADSAFSIAKHFVPQISDRDLRRLTKDAFNFPVPLVPLGDGVFLLELFHGPTMAFKDFGARFLSRISSFFLRQSKKKMTIIVATSGDTGSAVASGFFKVPHVRIFILYPSGKVSPLQEKQLTTYGGNITAIEVKGTFDDCQKLAKQALADRELVEALNLSSANSINFGRLLPQSFYYFWAWKQLQEKGIYKDPVFVVPSGNFGNGFAGLMAKRMGLPVSKFVFATNANAIVPSYLKTGKFLAQKSKNTISNAMDVGNPSNFARILALYDGKRVKMKEDIWSESVSDGVTKKTIRRVFEEYGYTLDPHTAVGVAAAWRFRKETKNENPIVVLSTAHPAKFREVVEPVIGKKITLPLQLRAPMKKKKHSHLIPASYGILKKFLLTHED